ncbi:AraC family transcriptional regulator [Yoonia maricola]|uniref:AraC family transcriptional regulator n=1 Tax=Yoonia maricola TaxID=420999 RepID=A0A2M8WM05_9RHOB|nr:helix-turn-helix domain-containing protein [Yoonia maricola]PJI91958.1 AraC family transcriptional regulator [Yoonia maricola]
MNMMSKQEPALALAAITYGGPSARWRTEAMRSHAGGRLIHITKGQGRITVAGLTNGYGPNNLIYIPPGTMYGMEVGPTVFGQILTLPDVTGWPDAPFHLRLLDVDPQKELVGLIEAIERELQPNGDLRAANCHFGLLSIFVERQLENRDPAHVDARRKTAAAQLVAQYTAMVAQNMRSGRSVASYAETLGVTPTHLTRSCRKTCGRSALSLLNDSIYFEACMMLKETKMPIQDIAQHLGFRSPAYFTRSFQEKSGQTPRDFRQKGAISARS